MRVGCRAFSNFRCLMPPGPIFVRVILIRVGALQLWLYLLPEFSGREILAGKAPQDAPVTTRGWVRTRRDSKAGISFVHVSDGSSFHPVQVVAPNTLPNYADEVLKLTAGCAVEATGTVVPSPAKWYAVHRVVNSVLLEPPRCDKLAIISEGFDGQHESTVFEAIRHSR